MLLNWNLFIVYLKVKFNEASYVLFSLFLKYVFKNTLAFTTG